MGTFGSLNLDTTSVDVEQHANFAAFPGTGEANVIYIAQDDNKTYRWDGAAYVEISVDTVSVDVETHANFAAFPGTGQTGVIYIDEADNKTYRWDGAGYVEISVDTISVDFEQHANTGAFPVLGELNVLYLAQDTELLYYWDGATYQPVQPDLTSVDDEVQEYANFAAFPGTGQDGTIYVDEATGDLYRWDGATYQPIGGEDLTGYVQTTDIDTIAELNAIVTDCTILCQEDIDTLSELNSIVTDATLIDTNDPRLADEIEWYANFASFPGTGVVDILYIDKALNKSYRWDGAAYVRIDEEAGGGGQLEHKSGEVLAGSFASNPKTASVTFSTAFADANYSIQLTALMVDENNAHQPFAYNKTASGFSISLGTNTTTSLTSVMWTATKFGEE